jgi:dTDP-4-amino-4,6-dideoxygalactose transaminase
VTSPRKPSRPLRDSFLVFGAPCLGEEEKREVRDCLDSAWLGTGPKVARFEELFRAYQGAEHAVAVSSGTAALHVALIAAELGPEAEVVVPAMTFCATVNAVLHAGARPVLADIDPITQNIDPADAARRITPRTRAILPVHFAGRPCDMAELSNLAERHGLMIIEDCAHAIETMRQGRHAGSFGAFGCFSFYATKNMTTGEGGMVVCRDEKSAARIKRLALHGLSADAWRRFSDTEHTHYDVVEAGFKYNMMDLQAAIGIHQLARIDQGLRHREKVWAMYDDAFSALPVTRPAVPAPDTIHARHLYNLLIDEEQCGVSRDSFLRRMTAARIGVGVQYRSIPEHSFYRNACGWRAEDYPHALSVGRRTVSLPLSAGLKDEDVEDVVTAVRWALDAA